MYEEKYCPTEGELLTVRWQAHGTSGYMAYMCDYCPYEEPILESVQSAILEVAGVVAQTPQQQE